MNKESLQRFMIRGTIENVIIKNFDIRQSEVRKKDYAENRSKRGF